MRSARWLLILCIGVLCLRVVLPQEAGQNQAEWLEILSAADAAYRNGNITLATDLYNLLLAQGVQDVVVYYNLATAYLELGNFAGARLYYRRAQHIAPRDPDIAMGVEQSRAQSRDADVLPSYLHTNFARLSQGVLTSIELAFVTLAVWVTWVIVVAFVIGLRRPSWLLRAIFWLFTLGLVVSITLMGTRWYVETYEAPAIVMRNARVHSGPGAAFVQMYTIETAREVFILDQQADWLKFMQLDGRRGWVQADAIKHIIPP